MKGASRNPGGARRGAKIKFQQPGAIKVRVQRREKLVFTFLHKSA